jgi:hypothetical protein
VIASEATRVNEVAAMCVADWPMDYTGLLHIAGRVRRVFGQLTAEEEKRLSLEVVRVLLQRGHRPGDYIRSGMNYWKETPQQAIERINREWIPGSADPTLAAPICWFGLPD